MGGGEEFRGRRVSNYLLFPRQDCNSRVGTNRCLLLLFQIKSHGTGTLEEMRLMWRPLVMHCLLKSSSGAMVMPVLSWHIWPIRDRVVSDLFPLRFVTNTQRESPDKLITWHVNLASMLIVSTSLWRYWKSWKTYNEQFACYFKILFNPIGRIIELTLNALTAPALLNSFSRSVIFEQF